MKQITLSIGAMLLLCMNAHAFCGFYVAKAGASLFNKASQVILVRDGSKTVVTMNSDFSGDVDDFAMVVPVPTILQREDIQIADPGIFSFLDEYSAPRMVEYFDQSPCMRMAYPTTMEVEAVFDYEMDDVADKSMREEANKYKVKIEAQYEIEEYDILILSAEESNGLKIWLQKNGYNIPKQAEEVLDPYIKNKLKFFVVKVDKRRMQNPNSEYLRPLQISYTSERFMLPIRLGMANADGAQDMIIYAFTPQGKVECTNYRTVSIPTDREIPSFVKSKGLFPKFYKDLFNRAYEREGENAVFLEYAWNVTPSFGGMKCDPCIGPPPMHTELLKAGIPWLDASNPWNAKGVFFTRLHVRYDRDNFPQDLFFQVTPDQTQRQGRYVIRHAAQGDLSCEAGQAYLIDLEMRRKKEVDELAALTGWKDPRYSRYIYEYSNRIQEERNAIPILDTGKDGGGTKGPSVGLFILSVFSILSLFWLFYLPQPKNMIQ